MAAVAEIILPLAVKSNFDYRIPEHLLGQVQPGMRALVVFGKNKLFTGVVRRVFEVQDPEQLRRLKHIDSLPDAQPVLQAWQLKLFEWIAFYYFCTEGEVVKAALPSGLKLESAMVVLEGPYAGSEALSAEGPERDLLEMLRVKPNLSLQEVAELWGVQNPGTRLRNMAARGLILLDQRLREGYKPLTERYVELADFYRNEEALHDAFAQVQRAPRQEEVLMLVAGEFFQKRPLARKELLKRIEGAEGAIRALVQKGVLREVEVQVDRLMDMQYRLHTTEIVLNAQQQQALAAIRGSFTEAPARPVLLHGVTGSGKTQVYIDLMRDYLAAGKQVLYLLPEIALTQQIIDRVKTAFGERVGVYHSRFSDAERVEIWQKVLAGDYDVVIGVRSAVFLPFARLGLVVVDEEHDHSFKQSEPNPRYHARDLVAWAAHQQGFQVLLGSATPSFETYHNALSGKYTLVEMPTRAVDASLPEIEKVDMREQRRRKLGYGVFSEPLLLRISETLARREQIILFQNRRGFVPWLLCTNCGHVPKCVNCDISLTYHKSRKHLRCHYCGHTELQTSHCTVCHSHDLKPSGVGTERIEEELKERFPEARVARMDLDTTRSRLGFLKLIRAFEKQEIDVLVGTQMVSKGLDFENVTLVGIVEADQLLNFADFRAYEHAYQLLTQVSGRAGRSTKRGRVVLQTFMPDQYVLQLLQHDFRLFYQREMQKRQELGYPPLSRLIRMELRHKDADFLERESVFLSNLLRPAFGTAMLGPETPGVARLRNEYRKQILFKVGKQNAPEKVRKFLQEAIRQYYDEAEKKTLRIVVDVDPV